MCGVCGVCVVCVFAPIHCEQFLRIVALSSPKDILNYAVVSIRYSFTGDVPIASLVQFKRSSLPGYRAPKRSKYSSLPLGSFVGGQIGLVLLRLGFGCLTLPHESQKRCKSLDLSIYEPCGPRPSLQPCEHRVPRPSLLHLVHSLSVAAWSSQMR